MTLAMIIALIVGLGLVLVGLLGRRVGDEPRCRKCGFDLSGLATPRTGACPECGADLSAPKATRTGVRKRRTRVAIVGVLCSAPLAAWAGFLVATSAMSPAVRPNWLLLPHAQFGPISGQGDALDEIIARHGRQELAEDDVAPIARRALAIIADGSREWDPNWTASWGAFAQWAQQGGLLSNEQLIDYVRATHTFEITVHPAVVDRDVQIGVQLTRSNRIPTTRFSDSPLKLSVDVRSIKAGDAWSEVGPWSTGQRLAITLYQDRSGLGHQKWSAPITLEPGVRDIRAKLEVYTRSDAPPGPDKFGNVGLSAVALPRLTDQAAARGHVDRTWTVTASTRVLVVAEGDVIEPVTSDEAVEDLKRSTVAALYIPKDFDDAREPPPEAMQKPFFEDQTLPVCRIRITASSVGGSFGAWFVSPNDRLYATERHVIVFTRGVRWGDDAGIMVRLAGDQNWAQQWEWLRDPPDPSSVPGVGWRLLLEPVDNRRLWHADEGDPLLPDWAPPPTLVRRVVIPLTRLEPGGQARLAIPERARDVVRFRGVHDVFPFFLLGDNGEHGDDWLERLGSRDGELHVAAPPWPDERDAEAEGGDSEDDRP